MTLTLLAWLMSTPVPQAAHRHGLDPWLVAVVAWHESRLDHRRVSRAGARGVLQVMPEWVQPGRLCAGMNLTALVDNIDCGTRLLARGFIECAGDLGQALGWYHGGKCKVDGYSRYVQMLYRRLTKRQVT